MPSSDTLEKETGWICHCTKTITCSEKCEAIIKIEAEASEPNNCKVGIKDERSGTYSSDMTGKCADSWHPLDMCGNIKRGNTLFSV